MKHWNEDDLKDSPLNQILELSEEVYIGKINQVLQKYKVNESEINF